MGYLELKNLTVEFSGFRAVNEVNMTIEKGELRTLIGPNGVGKTTLLKSIIGLLQDNTGDIRLNSDKVTKLKPYERSIGTQGGLCKKS